MHWLDVSKFARDSTPAPLAADAVQLWLWRDDAGDAARRARVRLRRRLAIHLGVEGVPLRFFHGPHGKPALDQAGAPHFNWSHSGTITALALAQAIELGVDVEEPRRTRDVMALARRYFAPAESAALARLSGPVQEAAFYSLWTCKEAVLKALGRGIAFGLHRLEFDLQTSDGQPLALVHIAEDGGVAAEWQICRFEPATGSFGALAWRGPALHVRGGFATD
jgi:4'-phosphopantetheinyl transferase